MTPTPFLGNDPAIREVLDLVRLLSPTDATVLITGETGTGKELIARALHHGGPRCRRPFLAVNCGALSETLLESELFGHMRGAFTGAVENRAGKFEAADTGTIFLDEIADMSPALQVLLLRVLQTGEYSPVGSAETRRTNVRVVAATNQPIKPLMAAGIVRADLYYRLNVVCLDLPPLRTRRGDIPVLVAHFLARHCGSARPVPAIDPGAHDILCAYDYPGNVRELENAMRRAVILCGDGPILPRHLPRDMIEEPAVPRAPSRDFHRVRARVLEDFEREYLIALMRESGGIVSRAAIRGGLSERNLHVKLKKHGLRGASFRAAVETPSD